MKYIITEFRPAETTAYLPSSHVYAPPGYLRRADGTVYRDGTPPTSGPEWGPDATKAFRFDTHRKAARVLGRCGSRAVIVTLKA